MLTSDNVLWYVVCGMGLRALLTCRDYHSQIVSVGKFSWLQPVNFKRLGKRLMYCLHHGAAGGLTAEF